MKCISIRTPYFFISKKVNEWLTENPNYEVIIATQSQPNNSDDIDLTIFYIDKKEKNLKKWMEIKNEKKN